MSAVAEYRELVSADELRMRLREAVAADLHDRGVDRETVLAALDDVRREARDQGRDEIEDVVMEVMDFVVGWSNPRLRL
jgi:hypothetical protein